MVDGKRVLQVPQELVYVFREADGKELKKRVQQNSEYFQLVRGLLYYYGIINYYNLYDLVSRYRKIEDSDLPYFFRALEQGAEFYGGIDVFSSGYACEWVWEPEEVKREHNMREDLDYFPFTYEQVTMNLCKVHLKCCKRSLKFPVKRILEGSLNCLPNTITAPGNGC
jgi:hypothetical protein